MSQIEVGAHTSVDCSGFIDLSCSVGEVQVGDDDDVRPDSTSKCDVSLTLHQGSEDTLAHRSFVQWSSP